MKGLTRVDNDLEIQTVFRSTTSSDSSVARPAKELRTLSENAVSLIALFQNMLNLISMKV